MSINAKLTLKGYPLELAQHLKIDNLEVDSDQYRGFSNYADLKYVNEAMSRDNGPSFMEHLVVHPPQAFEGLVDYDGPVDETVGVLHVLHHGFVLSEIYLPPGEYIVLDGHNVDKSELERRFPEFAKWMDEYSAALFST